MKNLELYDEYTEGLMDLVDNTEDTKAMFDFYDSHKEVNKSVLLLWRIEMRKSDKSRTEHLSEMQRVIHENENIRSEYRK